MASVLLQSWARAAAVPTAAAAAWHRALAYAPSARARAHEEGAGGSSHFRDASRWMVSPPSPGARCCVPPSRIQAQLPLPPTALRVPQPTRRAQECWCMAQHTKDEPGCGHRSTKVPAILSISGAQVPGRMPEVKARMPDVLSLVRRNRMS